MLKHDAHGNSAKFSAVPTVPTVPAVTHASQDPPLSS